MQEKSKYVTSWEIPVQTYRHTLYICVCLLSYFKNRWLNFDFRIVYFFICLRIYAYETECGIFSVARFAIEFLFSLPRTFRYFATVLYVYVHTTPEIL